MKLLDGREVASYIMQRHAGLVSGLEPAPKLAIVRSTDNEGANRYLRAKSNYGASIGVTVEIFVETPETILQRIHALNADPQITGLIVQLPLPTPELTDAALAAVDPAKDVDGLAPGTRFETATPKAALWLLASHNVEISGHIVVVGQGRLVGRPLADRLEASGHEVTRCDIHTKDLGEVTRRANMIFTGTGQPGLITGDMVSPGTVLVDTGAPLGELDASLYERDDLIITPNPGGVGPMTVAALFDNLLIAAQMN